MVAFPKLPILRRFNVSLLIVSILLNRKVIEAALEPAIPLTIGSSIWRLSFGFVSPDGRVKRILGVFSSDISLPLAGLGLSCARSIDTVPRLCGLISKSENC